MNKHCMMTYMDSLARLAVDPLFQSIEFYGQRELESSILSNTYLQSLNVIFRECIEPPQKNDFC